MSFIMSLKSWPAYNGFHTIEADMKEVYAAEDRLAYGGHRANVGFVLIAGLFGSLSWHVSLVARR